MLSYNIVKEKPKVLLAFTSLTTSEFQELLVAFEKVSQQDSAPDETVRQRAAGGGRKPTINKYEDQLLFILFYMKTYPVQEVMAFLFSMSQAQTNEWIHRLANILQKALAELNYLPERDATNLADSLKAYGYLEFVQDGTERQRERPKDEQKQRAYYSGKKKKHTVKNNLVVHPESRQVCYLSPTVPGKKHDKKLADETEMTFPINTILEQDTGYQGYQPERVIILQPKKKPKGKELSTSDKFINKVISSGRILVENIIAGIKRCRIVKDVFRNKKDGFADLVMEIACGLHNLRVTHRTLLEPISLVDFYFR
jgi:hypothetical protein